MSKVKVFLPWILIGCLVFVFAVPDDRETSETKDSLESFQENNPFDKVDPVELKEGRAEYFFKLMRDPATNSIPNNIRAKELEFAQTLPSHENRNRGFQSAVSGGTAAAASLYDWKLIGPTDVGGRTRALGIDQRNSDILIAGGVSGGIYKSTDGGATWTLKSDINQNFSVTSLAQDPTAQDVWYYSSGEFRGNSARDRGGRASYFGTGIFKSTDNGETWSRLSATADTDASFNSPFDFVSRIVISPAGNIFLASNGNGIYKSTDDGASFSLILGGSDQHEWTDVAVADDGTLVAVLSESDSGDSNNSPGVFLSTDEGTNWDDITPSGFPNTHRRSVVDIAPSNTDIIYVFTQKGSGDSSNQGVSFFKIDVSGGLPGTADDRSANLPDFGDPVGGVNTQINYNMVVKVKPDDPNFVMIGGTNLFRSTDGFATPPVDNSTAEKDKFWIGGYAKANNVSQYSNHHPDQHVLVFDPADSNRLWSGHDGGLSLTTDVTAASVSWTDQDDDYVTSQFYTVYMPVDTTDTRVMGGTQDNGTPFFQLDDAQNPQAQTGVSDDISSGDGSHGAFTENYTYVSRQRGSIIKWESGFTDFDFVHPLNESGQLFIHPFAVDPNDENIMYYPGIESGAPVVWRNTSIDQIENGNEASDGTTTGWSSMSTGLPSGYDISTLEVSRSPTDILYVGASATSSQPKILRIDDASSSFSPTDISISAALSGSYVHDIALNPVDADELLAVMSNYNIPGIFHSSDGGSTWTEIEGNLTGTISDPGPSIRSAAIIPAGSGTIYLVGTSTGIYSTDNLDGSNTQWIQEGASTLGFAVTEFLNSRITDGRIAAGTHGRGIFLGLFQGSLSLPGPPIPPQNVTVASGPAAISISWDENTEIDLAEYRVYKGEEPNSLSLLQTVDKSSSSFLDNETTIKPFFYRVTAVDQDGNESDFSNIVAAYREDKPVDTDWQLVGSPVLNSNSVDLPGGVQLVGFSGAYQVADALESQKGYWAKSSSSETVSYNGAALVSSSIPLKSGWNLIGGVADTVASADIKDPGGILSATPVQRYDGNSYVQADSINPSEGYFIHAQSDGNIEIVVDTSSGGGAEAPPVVAGNESPSLELDQLRFTKDGYTQSLFVSKVPLSSEQKQYYRVPPVAPDPLIDVRTEDGYRIADEMKVDVSLTVRSYPVQIHLPSDASGSYRLIGINEGEEVYYDLEPGKTATLDKGYDRLLMERLDGDVKPLKTELKPNYPNPFNPSTTIEYQLASQTLVKLEVYNIVGRRVQTLVNGIQQPGIYTVNFDAGNLSSGTYFVRIVAGEFQRVQKMTLIK